MQFVSAALRTLGLGLLAVTAACVSAPAQAPVEQPAPLPVEIIEAEQSRTSKSVFDIREMYGDADVDLVTRKAFPPEQCNLSDTQQFPWPPPEPTDRVKLDPRWFKVGAGESTPVSDVAAAIQRAFKSIGHVQIGYQSIGCDGFAVISYLERIDSQGRPLPDEVRFLPPGAKEPWSLTGYLTRLLTAPEGKYRQIVIVGTDKPMDEFGDAPTSSEVLDMFDVASPELPESLKKYAWNSSHRLVALIYEFERPAGRGDPIRVPPRGLGGTKHLTGAGLYKPTN
ncbi:MAG: hypothetical protein Q8S09_08015 [Hyphomonas sp.]|nr:hypothetical protein [Hyphomonas sp.]MDP3459202.1 hypothetical protein [Hyphomonas sp.]